MLLKPLLLKRIFAMNYWATLGSAIVAILFELLDPVRFVLVAIPAVLLIKTAKPQTPVPNWYNQHHHALWISMTVGAVGSIVYSSTPWFFSLMSALIIALIVIWLRAQWLLRKETTDT